MQITLVLQTPAGQTMANIDDSIFVLNNDLAFVPAREASWVMLRSVDRTATDITYELNGNQVSITLTPGDTGAKVVEVIEPALTSNLIDRTIIVHDAPFNGACTCLITCKGTNITFVKVESI